MDKRLAVKEERDVRERRIHRRMEFREPVQYQFMGRSEFGGCLACDISESGIKVNVNDFVPLETELALQIPLGNGKAIDCPGRVVWIQRMPFSDRYQAGLEFDLMDSIEDVRNDIRQYIKSF